MKNFIVTTLAILFATVTGCEPYSSGDRLADECEFVEDCAGGEELWLCWGDGPADTQWTLYDRDGDAVVKICVDTNCADDACGGL